MTRHGRASRNCVNGVCVQGTVICLRLTRGRRRRRWLARASMSMRCGLQTLLEAARFVELQEEFEKQQLVTLHAAGNYNILNCLLETIKNNFLLVARYYVPDILTVYSFVYCSTSCSYVEQRTTMEVMGRGGCVYLAKRRVDWWTVFSKSGSLGAARGGDRRFRERIESGRGRAHTIFVEWPSLSSLSQRAMDATRYSGRPPPPPPPSLPLPEHGFLCVRPKIR